MAEKWTEHVLFVCTGNTCRSPMAEALYNKLAREKGIDSFATSAGISAYEGLPASMGASCVMEEMGADLSFHFSKSITPEMMADAGVVLCMQDRQEKKLRQLFPEYKDKIHTLYEYAFGRYESVLDPFGGDTDVYRRCAQHLEKAIKKILEI